MEVNSELLKLLDYYKTNKIAHAYLITTNDVNKCVDELFCVLKKFFEHNLMENVSQIKLLDNLIDKKNFPNIILIEPDGTKIKKEQISNLKYSFAMTSQFASLKVYIIKNAEKMNKESNNSILKFLEDPYKDTIGFFITNEKNNILDTIISRCENIVVNYDLNSSSDLEEIDQTLLEIAYEYLKLLEIKSGNILINQEIVLNNISDRKDLERFIKIIFKIYNDALKFKISQKGDSNEKFSFIFEQNVHQLKKKNYLLEDLLKELNYNVNIELLLDRFVIEIGEINNENIWSSI